MAVLPFPDHIGVSSHWTKLWQRNLFVYRCKIHFDRTADSDVRFGRDRQIGNHEQAWLLFQLDEQIEIGNILLKPGDIGLMHHGESIDMPTATDRNKRESLRLTSIAHWPRWMIKILAILTALNDQLVPSGGFPKRSGQIIHCWERFRLLFFRHDEFLAFLERACPRLIANLILVRQCRCCSTLLHSSRNSGLTPKKGSERAVSNVCLA